MNVFGLNRLTLGETNSWWCLGLSFAPRKKSSPLFPRYVCYKADTVVCLPLLDPFQRGASAAAGEVASYAMAVIKAALTWKANHKLTEAIQASYAKPFRIFTPFLLRSYEF